MPALITAARGAAHWCLRPFKATARRLMGRLVSEPTSEMSRRTDTMAASQATLEAFRRDHAALSRRLAAMEDHLEKLLNRHE